MGKVGGGGATTAKKRKGRPSLLDLQKRARENEQLQNQQKLQPRSTRRNPNSTTVASVDDDSANEDEYYDDDERKEKKVKLVVRLPQSNQLQQQHASSDLIRSYSVNSGSYGSDSNANVDNRKINSGSGNIIADNQGEKASKVTVNVHGSPLESGPTTPLPDKKLLVFILDRLQKKDTHGVFSEPVDPNELPDYHEIIEHPMDFGTVRSKLDEGLYSRLDELEADVFLICSNAMQYNSSDTIYFRQARTIQELAKRDFGNLRHEGDDGELQPKVVKRGRPPSKHLKRPPGRPPFDGAGPESTSGATLATTEDNTTESTPYNLRKGPMLYRHQADGLLGSNRDRNGEQHSELLSDWNEEFPARIRRADMKYGNKHVIIDETRRDTYKQYLSSFFADNPSPLSNFCWERKQLMAVGLHAEHGYTRSLARFAANLGPVVSKIASKKIEKKLPPEVKSSCFPSGNQRCMPGLVSHNVPKRSEIPNTSGADPDIEADTRVNSQNETTNSTVWSFGSKKWF
ncbi:transcription factor GTE4-like [Cynara cardunculus var. scolymus]|uniref:Bromo domain-containing protein n=1 Tax=Cynara cardunculus var. scolymus TaxID=59895 RepID=A0A118K4E8_CYNCS|nr:transcription factor GTE4-like [Cynara cardunculus var. scolymus]KVI07382.1 hypothetical protein Ccrd_014334 [Cynara cardunculus var. scolymus]